MIEIEQPAMAVNDVRDLTPAQMWNTWYVQPTDTRKRILDWVAHVARYSTAAGKLNNLVLCCHGAPGSLELGEGFDKNHTPLFAAWAGLIETIWIRACQFTYFPKPGTQALGAGGLFCSEIAQYARCQVIASMDALYIGQQKPLSYGELDGFEGLTLSYAPDGTVTRWYKPHHVMYNELSFIKRSGVEF